MCVFFFFGHGSTALVNLHLLCEVRLSHSDTPHSVGLISTSDRPVVETSTWQHTTITTDRHSWPPGGVRTRNPSKSAAAGPRLRPRGMLWLIKPDIKQSVLQTLHSGYESLLFVLFTAARSVSNTELCLWERHPFAVPPVVTESQRAQVVVTTRLHFQRFCLHCDRQVVYIS